MMFSRRRFVVFCFVLILLCCAGCGFWGQARSPSEPQVELDKTWTLSVFPFKTVDESGLSGEEAMNLVSTELVNVKGFKIVEREALDAILGKYGIELGNVPTEERADLGKLLGAQLICFGHVNRRLKLAFARVVFTETGEVLVAKDVNGGKEVKNVRSVARKLKDGLLSAEVINELNKSGKKDEEKRSLPQDVEVKGYGDIVNGDITTARKLALRDAFVNAIRTGCGIRILKHMQIEKHVAVKNMILTESVGYVTSYEVLDENPNSEFGYEVVVRASVSRQPISDLEKLKLIVKYLHVEPRIIVLIDGSIEGDELEKSRADEIAGRISSRLGEAGFLIAAPEIIAGGEDAVQPGNIQDVDLIVRGTLNVKVVDRTGGADGENVDFSIISAITTGVFQVIRPETTEVIFSFDHDALPPDRKDEIKGFGNTDDKAIANSINGFISVSAEKLAWEIASKLEEQI